MGNFTSGKCIDNLDNYNFFAAAGAGVGGGIAGPYGSSLANKLLYPPASHAAASLMEGVGVGVGELIGSQLK